MNNATKTKTEKEFEEIEANIKKIGIRIQFLKREMHKNVRLRFELKKKINDEQWD